MAAPTTGAQLHHRIPRCLLRVRDRADAADLDGAGIGAWLEWEIEAMSYGVDPDVGREALPAIIEGSAVPIPADDHRRGHSAAGDFARWGRRGGLRTLELYGSPWFSALALRRWGKISAAALRAARSAR